MEEADEHPMVHEIGHRTYLVARVAPLDLDGVRTMQVGTLLWVLGALALLPFWHRLQHDGHLWWLWTCVVGAGLGLIGIRHTIRRRRHRHRREDRVETSAAGTPT